MDVSLIDNATLIAVTAAFLVFMGIVFAIVVVANIRALKAPSRDTTVVLIERAGENAVDDDVDEFLARRRREENEESEAPSPLKVTDPQSRIMFHTRWQERALFGSTSLKR